MWDKYNLPGCDCWTEKVGLYLPGIIRTGYYCTALFSQKTGRYQSWWGQVSIPLCHIKQDSKDRWRFRQLISWGSFWPAGQFRCPQRVQMNSCCCWFWVNYTTCCLWQTQKYKTGLMWVQVHVIFHFHVLFPMGKKPRGKKKRPWTSNIHVLTTQKAGLEMCWFVFYVLYTF